MSEDLRNPWTVINGGRQGWLLYDDRDRMGLAPEGSTSQGYIAAFPTELEAFRESSKRYKKWLDSPRRENQ